MVKLVVGPTASGKSEYVNAFTNSIIINADSRQLYKELPVLCAIPDNLTNHFLYKILSHEQKITVVGWLKKVNEVIAQNSNKNIIIVGGTGLYFKVLMHGIVSLPKIKLEIMETVEKMNLIDVQSSLLEHEPKVLEEFKDERRLKKALAIFLQEGKSILEFFEMPREKLFTYEYELIKIMPERDLLRKRILYRLEKDFDRMVQEVQNSNLENSEVIGFQEIKLLIQNKITQKRCKELIFYKVCQYAKRQRTYINNCL